MTSEIAGLVDNLFRQQARQMISTLTRLLGSRHLDLVEEVVQEALAKALQLWPYQGVPANPRAWLIQVAKNRAIDRLRHTGRHEAALEETLAAWQPDSASPLADSELALIFLCCHPTLPVESRLALTLKTACGFSTREIARAFLTEETTIAQRIVRAKRQLRAEGVELDMPYGRHLVARLDSVLQVVYLLFSEGYASSDAETLLRQELCEEAIRLGRLLGESPEFGMPATHALVALLLFQSARSEARLDLAGQLVRLGEQDRSLWNRAEIGEAYRWFERSLAGDEESRYHLEAAIAAQHCGAQDSGSTDWACIVEMYDRLYGMQPSPVVALNRAVAIARLHGPREGLALLDELGREPSLRSYSLLPAVEGQLWREAGEPARALECFRRAMALSGNGTTRRFLERQIEEVLP